MPTGVRRQTPPERILRRAEFDPPPDPDRARICAVTDLPRSRERLLRASDGKHCPNGSYVALSSIRRPIQTARESAP